MLQNEQPEEGPIEEKARLLSLISILQPLSWDEIRDLARRIPDVRLGKGQTLYTPKYRSGMLFLLLEGQVRLYEVAQGREFTLLVVRTGELFGEMRLVNQQVQGAYAQALEPSRISLMSRDIFDRTVLRRPEVGLRMVDLLSERVAQYGGRLADIGIKEVHARLASLILRLVESEGTRVGGEIRISTRYTHYQLGTMIGANREAVTNAMTQLRVSGALTTRHRYIHVTDVNALKKAAGAMSDIESEY